MSDSQIKADEATKFIDDILTKVINVIDLGLDNKQRDLKIRQILETKYDEQNTLFDLVEHKESSRYSLLLGFCFMLGVGTLKDEKQALKNWEDDDTSYGKYMAGVCYLKGLEKSV